MTIGVAAAVASKQAPYCFLKNIRLVDDVGTDRISAPGHHIWALNCLRKRTLEYRDIGVMFSSPLVPTAIGPQNITFYMDIPISYTDTDLRGALNGRVAGDIYLNVDFDDLLIENGNSDRLYSGANTSTVVLNSGTLKVYQRYLQSAYPAPEEELATIHYIEGGLKISDGIVANSERLINYPINRRTLAGVLTYVSGGAMNTSDVAQIRMIIGPSDLWRYGPDAIYARQRDRLFGGSLPENFFSTVHELPFQTNQTRQNQLGFTPSAAALGNTYIGVTWESFS